VQSFIAHLRRVALLPLLAVPPFALAAPAPDELPGFDTLDSVEARVQGCVTCHGRNGQGASNGNYPRIAGKPPGYLYNQLVAFRDGTRRYAPMNYLLAYMPDAYLHEIADHFAQQRPPFAQATPATTDRTQLERGRRVAMEGDFHTGVPPCVACHGVRLTGMTPAIPGLAGLRAAYITAQLARWRSGERRAAAPDCMKRVADRLDDASVDAVAAWLSAQPAPANPAPEAPDLARMPYACGSMAEERQ